MPSTNVISDCDQSVSTEYVCEDFRVNTDFKVLCVSLCHVKVFTESTFLPFCYFLCNKPLENILAPGIHREKRMTGWSREGRGVCRGTHAGPRVGCRRSFCPRAHEVGITVVPLSQTGNQESETRSDAWLVRDPECRRTSLWDQSLCFFSVAKFIRTEF